jgi:hypothetical protein
LGKTKQHRGKHDSRVGIGRGDKNTKNGAINNTCGRIKNVCEYSGVKKRILARK